MIQAIPNNCLLISRKNMQIVSIHVDSTLSLQMEFFGVKLIAWKEFFALLI